jgi:hypothetical protein
MNGSKDEQIFLSPLVGEGEGRRQNSVAHLHFPSTPHSLP